MELKCPKCAGAMERGVLVEYHEATGASATVWMEGAPQYGFFGGLKHGGKKQLRVDVFRCGQCGFLESYATKSPWD